MGKYITPRSWKYKTYRKLLNCYRWQQLRRKKFTANPVCEACAAAGRVTPTEEVHHIIPVESGATEAEMKKLAYDYNNLQSLCKACHSAIHQRINERETQECKAFFARYLRGESF